MPDPFRYVAQFQTARGGWAALPPWARQVVVLCAVPGLVLVGLSMLLLGVSILALLLLTVPAYRVLQALTGTRPSATATEPVAYPTFSSPFGPRAGGTGTPGRRRVDATVTDRGDDTDPTSTD